MNGDDDLPEGYYSSQISSEDAEELSAEELLDRMAEVDKKNKGKNR